MGAFIEAEKVCKTYRVGKIEVLALRGISFTVRHGEFVTVVGPSGSGESTLFYVLGGLTRADSGRIVINGDDLSQLSDAELTDMRRRKIGFLFQRFNLLPTLDARSNILIAQDIAGRSTHSDPAYFQKITEMLGLTNRLHHLPSELSGGEQQRVALARALINKPAIVLADEPTGNLDSHNSHVVLTMLQQTNKELAQTIMMITHNPEAAAYGDRIIHMRDGQIVVPEKDPQWTKATRKLSSAVCTWDMISADHDLARRNGSERDVGPRLRACATHLGLVYGASQTERRACS
jgi:putative ABC transport system ATP-binding protein